MFLGPGTQNRHAVLRFAKPANRVSQTTFYLIRFIRFESVINTYGPWQSLLTGMQ